MYLLINKKIKKYQQKYIPYSFFFQNEWMRVIEETFKFHRFYFIFKNYKKTLLILPIHKVHYFINYEMISLPYSFNLKLDENNENVINNYLNDIKKKILNCKDVVIKSTFETWEGKKNFKTRYHYYQVDLADGFEMKFSKNIKRKINIKNVKYKFIKNFNSEDFNEFFENYLSNCKELKTFFYPKIFFNNLFKLMKKNFFILCCYQNNIFLGGILIFLDKKNSEGIYFISSKSNIGRKNSIDKVLLFRSMKLCKKIKIKAFNLGKTNIKNEGLNLFKSQFGSKKKTLNYFSLKEQNYSILDQQNIFRYIIEFIIKLMPRCAYKIFNNFLFKFLAKY